MKVSDEIKDKMHSVAELTAKAAALYKEINDYFFIENEYETYQFGNTLKKLNNGEDITDNLCRLIENGTYANKGEREDPNSPRMKFDFMKLLFSVTKTDTPTLAYVFSKLKYKTESEVIEIAKQKFVDDNLYVGRVYALDEKYSVEYISETDSYDLHYIGDCGRADRCPVWVILNNQEKVIRGNDENGVLQRKHQWKDLH